MSRILVVGHPHSGLHEVEALLHQCGMKPPQASKREHLLPQDITRMLRKAHHCPAVEGVRAEVGFEQLQVGPVWHGMALDLMLGNLEQPLWGWTDHDALVLLDYWSGLDPQLTVVMVYDRPHRVLLEGGALGFDEPEAVGRDLENWQAYNSAMLRFYLRHPQRCLLVNVQQAREALDSYLQQLQTRIGTVLSAPVQSIEHHDRRSLPAPVSGALVQAAMDAPELRDWFHGHGVVDWHLTDQVLQEYPAALQTYEELQAVASLPHAGTIQRHQTPVMVWRNLLEQRAATVQLVSRLCDRLHNETEERQRHRTESARLLQHNLDQHAAEQRQRQEEIACIQADRNRLVQSEAENQKERDWMLARMLQVQEELEAALLKGQELERNHAASLAVVHEARQSNTQQKADLESKLSQLQQQLKVQLTAAQATALQEQELARENKTLLAQLHSVQEQLEQCLIENRKLKQAPALYGAADRVRQQLAYRLGARMVAHSRSLGGWLSMVPALRLEVSVFRNEQAGKQPKKLPPLTAYADVHEAERLKGHLSYQLGQVLVRHRRFPLGWLRLPFELRAARKAYQRQRGGQ